LRIDPLVLVAIVILAAWGGTPAFAQSQPKATMEVPMLDPWVPPLVRKNAAATAPVPTEGAALRAQVERKLRASFDAAAATSGGTLTREQARAGGLGFIANNFDAIDRDARGAVSFGDYKRFLKERGAALD
jgi:hypothetical protein